MKKLLMVLAVTLCGLNASAQNEASRWTITLKVGLNWASTTDPDIYIATSPEEKVQVNKKIGLAIGAEAEYQWNQQLALSAGLIYSQQGSRWADVKDFWENYKTSVDYLNIPILLNLYVAPGFAVKAGIQPAIKLHSNVSVDNLFLSVNQHTSNSDTDHKTLELGIPIGASYAIGNWQMDLRYNLGLTYMREHGEYFPEKNRVLQLTIGYRFEL